MPKYLRTCPTFSHLYCHHPNPSYHFLSGPFNSLLTDCLTPFLPAFLSTQPTFHVVARHLNTLSVAYELYVKTSSLTALAKCCQEPGSITSPTSSLLPVHKCPSKVLEVVSLRSLPDVTTIQPLNFSLNDPCCPVYTLIYSPLPGLELFCVIDRTCGSEIVGLTGRGPKSRLSFSLGRS